MAAFYNLNDHRQHQHHPRSNNYTVCKKTLREDGCAAPLTVLIYVKSALHFHRRGTSYANFYDNLCAPNQTVPPPSDTFY